MNLQLDKKVVFVTGASRGIGKAIALHLGQGGGTVIGTATTQQGADKISEYLDAAQIPGCGMPLNVNEPESIIETVKKIQSDHGAVQVLVNNAGITRDNLLLRLKDDDWQSVIDTNLSAVFRVSKACVRGMMKARWGRIINISSISGFLGNPGQSNYCAAKMGLVGLSKSLAREIASRGITVNLVAPGFIDTDMTNELTDAQKETLLTQVPVGRLGSTDEIAGAVCFLASDAASYITGETLHVNGGMYMA